MRWIIDFTAIFLATVVGCYVHDSAVAGVLYGATVGAYGSYCYWDGLTIIRRRKGTP